MAGQIILRWPSEPVHCGVWFWLGAATTVRLREVVFSAVVKESVSVVDLSAYPGWLLVLGGTLVAAWIVWMLITLMKWALWLLFYSVLIGGLMWTGWLWLQ